ncbi:hypothetical protein QJS66_15225 [Kocuria rhizophila]|nr:hypothetical protein QJS66_15225 [Kocuria rhizophila]
MPLIHANPAHGRALTTRNALLVALLVLDRAPDLAAGHPGAVDAPDRVAPGAVARLRPDPLPPRHGRLVLIAVANTAAPQTRRTARRRPRGRPFPGSAASDPHHHGSHGRPPGIITVPVPDGDRRGPRRSGAPTP